MCNWVTMLYRRKMIEHCKPAIMEKIKIVIKKNTRKYFYDFKIEKDFLIKTQQAQTD